MGDNGQTWTYLNVSGRSSRITFVAKNFLQTGFAQALICGALCCNFFLHHSEIWSRKQMHGDARTTSDSERLTQLLHTRVLEMMIYFLWADATGKPANSNLFSNSVKQCTEFFWRLISKTCCSCPLLGPTDSILPQSGSDFFQCSSLDDTVWETNIRIDTTLYHVKTQAGFFLWLFSICKCQIYFSSYPLWWNTTWEWVLRTDLLILGTFGTCRSSWIFTCKYHLYLQLPYYASQSLFLI